MLAGHQALRYGQNSLNLEHPPLVKLVAALPLLAEDEPLAPPLEARDALENAGKIFERPDLARRVRISGRSLLLLVFGLPLLGACFALGRELGGWRSGALLALAAGLSSSVLPFVSVIQTDAAVSLGFVMIALAAIRLLKVPATARTVLLGLGLGVALASKFSGVLAIPAFALTFFLLRGIAWKKRALWLSLAALIALLTVASTYGIANRDYSEELGRRALSQYCRGEASLQVEDRLRPFEGPLLAVETVSPGLAQWLTGLLGIRAQDSIGIYPTYAFGEVRSQGRWWYFPAVFLIRTPLVLLLATLLALTAAGPRPTLPRELPLRGLAVLLVLVGVYGAAAITSNYNLGVRHLMPVMPLLFLPAVLWAARGRLRWWIVSGALIAEALILMPVWMSSTNTWWLGSRNPTRSALFSLEYHQSFLLLREALEERGIETVHVAFPALRETELHAYLPNARLLNAGDDVVPGWYALSLRAEQYVPALLAASGGEIYRQPALLELARSWQPLLQEIQEGEDRGIAAGTFHLYRVLPP